MRGMVLAMVFAAAGVAHGAPVIRDEATVLVGGVQELWQLVWAEKPSLVCRAGDFDSGTCPCSGFAYGEKGRLALVRKRAGKEIERMDLGVLPFDDAPGSGDARGTAYLQRWPYKTTDFERSDRGDATLAREVSARPQTKILNFADYNHDGYRTKFLLQIGTAPCGKYELVAIGVTAKNGHLHALASVENPKKPLVLWPWEWKGLLAHPERHREHDWDCMDHGSDTEDDLILSAVGGDIHVRAEAYACKDNGKRGRFLGVIARGGRP